MNPAAAFFAIVLSLQAVFTAAVVLLVGRRFPARLKLYRWVAPAALPFLMFLFVCYSFLSGYLAFLKQTGLPFDTSALGQIGKFAIAYGILWLIGVLFAGILIRLVLRRR